MLGIYIYLVIITVSNWWTFTQLLDISDNHINNSTLNDKEKVNIQ